jgi:LysR family transcriptional regulator, glycine cleavage system transcriptional activator
MSRPPLHALQGFVVAARSGNLSRAAESMHLTVSALSHQIKALEERLGYRLFVRGSRGIALTDDGRRLLEGIEPHLDAIERALRPFAARRDEVLTVSLIPSMASAWLIPRLSGFLAAHPQLEFHLQSTAELVDFARDVSVDAAIRSGSGQWPGLIAEHLFDESLVPVASPTLIRRLQPQLGNPSLRELHRWPLLGDPGGYWERWFAHFGTPRPARYVANFDDGDAVQRAAVEGVGVGLGRITRARPLIEADLLQPLLAESLHTDYAHYLVYPPRSQAHAGLRAFRVWLLEEAKAFATSQAKAQVKTSARSKR